MTEPSVRAVVGVAVGPSTGESARRHIVSIAREFGFDDEPMPLHGDWLVYFPSVKGQLPADVARRMGARLYETLMLDGEEARVVAHVVDGAFDSGRQDSELTALTLGAPEGYLTVSTEVARWLGEDERESLVPCRLATGHVVLISPDPTSAQPAGIAEVPVPWVPRLDRWVVPAAVPEISRELRGQRVDWLLRGPRRVALVIAPAWTGKSYVARYLHRLWDAEHRGPSELLSLADTVRNVWHPEYWSAWRRPSSDRALWIIDGADEAIWRGVSIRDVLSPLDDLREEELGRLTVLVFQRDDATLQRVERGLEGARLKDAPRFRLLPMGEGERIRYFRHSRGEEEAAAAMERASANLERLDAPFLEYNIQALDVLAELDGANPTDLWNALVRGLADPHHGLAGRSVSSDRLIDMAARLAAILTVSRSPFVSMHHHAAAPNWTDSFPADLLDDSEVLQRTSLLESVPEGFRFRERHIQELLAARGLESIQSTEVIRELISEPDGRFREDLSEVVEYLARLRPELRALLDGWSRRTTPPLAPERALQIVETLVEELVPGMHVPVRSETLHALNTPTVKEWAVRQLEDDDASEQARELALDLARELGWDEAVAPAVRIALDPAAPIRLRIHSVYLACGRGDAAIVDQLRPLLDDRTEEERHQQLRGRVLQALLDREPLRWILAQADPSEPHLLDARSILLQQAAQRLGHDEARWLLTSYLHPPSDASREVHPRVVHELAEPALRVVLEQRPWTDEDADLLAEAAKRDTLFRTELATLLEPRLSDDRAARGALYSRLLGSRGLWRVRNTLEVDSDLGWLLELARTTEGPPQALVEDLHRLARFGEGSAVAKSARAFLTQRHPELTAALDEAYEKGVARRLEWEAEREAERARAGNAPRPQPLAEALRAVLDADASPEKQLRLLSLLCFMPDGQRPTDIVGHFEDLSPVEREQTIARVRELLSRAEPTPTPAGTSFSSKLLHEAHAFAAAVQWDEQYWLDESIVQRWLPALLFATSDDRTDIARRCYAAHPGAATGATIREVQRDAGRHDYPFVAPALPEEMWREASLRRAVDAIIRDDALAQPHRGNLIALFASRTREHPLERRDVLRLARQLAERSDDIGVAAIDVLIALSPRDGVAHVGRLDDTQRLARSLESVIESHGELRGRLAAWDDEPLLALAAVLCRTTVSWDEPRGPHWVGPEDRLRELRFTVLRELGKRDSVDFSAIKAFLPHDRRERTVAWLRALRQQAPVQRIIASLSSPPAPVAPSRVVAALDQSVELGFRSIDDLFDVVSSLFAHEIRDAAPRYRDAVWISKGEFERIAKKLEVESAEPRAVHRDEGALQAIVQAMLIAELYRLSPSHIVWTFREPEEGHGDRPDFVLAGASIRNRPERLELPIELKWSDNPKCVPSITEQLGKRYLLEEGRTHGIYVVGYSGLAPNADLDGLRLALEAQQDALRVEYPHLRVGIAVLPFARSDT